MHLDLIGTNRIADDIYLSDSKSLWCSWRSDELGSHRLAVVKVTSGGFTFSRTITVLSRKNTKKISTAIQLAWADLRSTILKTLIYAFGKFLKWMNVNFQTFNYNMVNVIKTVHIFDGMNVPAEYNRHALRPCHKGVVPKMWFKREKRSDIVKFNFIQF